MVDFKIIAKSSIITIIILLASIVLMVCFIEENNRSGDKVLNNEGGIVSYDTQYGRVLIYNNIRNEENIRVLNIDSGYESATYTDKEKRNELVFEYLKFYDLMFSGNREIKDTLKMDVVEIDGKITEIAKQYFYLNDLINDYKLNENNRLNLITEDGRTYLNKNKKKYDAVLNDAFAGRFSCENINNERGSIKN